MILCAPKANPRVATLVTGARYPETEAEANQRHFNVQVSPNVSGAALADYAFLHIPDDDPRVQQMMAAATVELTFDGQGNATGINIYPYLTASATPNPATVNTTVTVTAVLLAGTPDTTVTFQVEGGTAYSEPVTAGQASHAYAFSAAGRYRSAVSSAHHGTAAVEVVVQ